MQMFSSAYDYSNPFPNFHSSSFSSYPTLPFLIDPENVNHFSNTLLDDPLSLPFIPTTTTSTHDAPLFHVQNQIQNEENVANLADCTAMFEQDASKSYASAIAAANYGGNNIPNYLTQKPAIAKKDRHSKIHTSQGLRDRRVRLSSEIARKFFDLQDMLEFDKPSSTLEWLFTKSENAIKELARSKNNNNNRCTEKDEVVNSNNNKSLTKPFGGNDGSKGKRLKWTQRGEDGFCAQSKKESRERARARARERTCYKRVQDFEENYSTRCPATTTTQMLQQVLMSSPIPNVQPYPPSQSHLLLDSEIQRDHHGYNVVEESIMIKRNMTSSQTHHHHQNLASFNNNIDNNIDYPLLPYTTPNWDPNGFSNFCGIATVNLSTCFMNQW